jgi:hypothetical protein
MPSTRASVIWQVPRIGAFAAPDGREYQVEITEGGSTTVKDCKALLNQDPPCFQKIAAILPKEPKEETPLPQTPIAAAALIMLYNNGDAGKLRIEVLDDDHAQFVFRDDENLLAGHLVRFSPCRFRISQYTTGRIIDLNFENLSREYTTVAETGVVCLVEGYRYERIGRTFGCLDYGTAPNGLTTLTLKGTHEQGKYPLCEGKVALAEAKHSQTEETIHLLPGGKCNRDVQNQGSSRSRIGAPGKGPQLHLN